MTDPDRSTRLADMLARKADETALQLTGEPSKADSELMEMARKGDREAYGKLFEHRAAGIWQMAYLILHDAEAAEDAVQETFTAGLEHLADFRGESEPRAWFCAIALNACRQRIRRRQIRETLAETSALEAARPHGPPKRGVLTSLLRHETSRRLAIALGFLTEPQREVFVLHYVEGLAFEEIARITTRKPGALRALAHRARAVLREKLREEETSLPRA
ncbi:MAG TPA: RNA polymerase sigma factor [Planctomycetota bacterium]|nr:RNA polymerase sigma factor [Planctomycetota bacterium]